MINRQTSNATYSSSIAHRHIALLTLPDHSMPPMETDATYQGCLPASYTVDHSLFGVHGTCNLEIAHMCYAILRLCRQSRDSENAQHNLEIVQIPRWCRTYILHVHTYSPAFYCVSVSELQASKFFLYMITHAVFFHS